jgi:RNA polymerase sigma-70 factor (ECF subfamily)
VGVDIDRRPTPTRPVRTVSADDARVSARDQGLVARASRGDVEAFRQLVQEHSSLIYRIAYRMLGGEHAQDASQEVWVKVWRYIGNFRGECAFSTWLHRITMNTCLTFRKRELHREEQQVGGEVSYLSEPSGGDADPEAAALSTERRDEIQAALSYVRAEHRAALVLRHMEGLSYAEIAEVLEVPDGTAKGWVSRGRAAMLVALAQEERAPDSTGEGNAP